MQHITMKHLKFKINTNLNALESPEGLLLKQGLQEFNRKILKESGSHFSITVVDNQQVIGGLMAETCSDAFYIKLLWVHESYRKAGIASKLIDMLTEKAIMDKVYQIFTDTYGFQAQGFYEKQGFTILSTVPKYMLGHDKIYLKKDL